MESLLIPLAPFIMVVAIVLTIFYFNSKNKREVLETVREALRGGQTLDPDTIRALGVPSKRQQGGDLKAGAILIAVALGFLGLGFAITGLDEPDAAQAFPVMAAIAAFPGLIGLVLVIFGAVSAAKRKDGGGPD